MLSNLRKWFHWAYRAKKQADAEQEMQQANIEYIEFMARHGQALINGERVAKERAVSIINEFLNRTKNG